MTPETAPAHCDAINAMFVCIIADDILGTPVLDDDLDVDVVGNAREEPLDLRLDALAMLVVVIVTRCVENLGIDLGDTGHASGDLEGRIIEVHGSGDLEHRDHDRYARTRHLERRLERTLRGLGTVEGNKYVSVHDDLPFMVLTCRHYTPRRYNDERDNSFSQGLGRGAAVI